MTFLVNIPPVPGGGPAACAAAPSTYGLAFHDGFFGSDDFRRDGAVTDVTRAGRINPHIYQVIVRGADEVVVGTLSDSVGMLDTSLRVAMP